MNTPKIVSIQTILGVKPDGIWGPQSQAALNAILQPGTVHHVPASSFADPADVAAFRRCRLHGGSEQDCLKIGDNGIGCWGDDTTGPVPMCALPPEDWAPLGAAARGRKVRVTVNEREVVCELRDTMPHRTKITNGAGIDLNPAAVAALGLRPPILVPATWTWA